MDQLIWKDTWNLGVESIDTEHRRLFGIIGELSGFPDASMDALMFQKTLAFFKEYMAAHFANEEAYMVSIQYPDLESHVRLHENFKNRLLPAIERELNWSEYSPAAVEHFLDVCVQWLIEHTLVDDQAIVSGKPCRWSHILPAAELEVLGDAITRLVHKMFLIDSRMISDTYMGEPLKRSLYYRLQYGSRSGLCWDVVVTFEQRFLVNTVGKMLDLDAVRLDGTLLNTLSQQFVYGIRQHLGDLDFDRLYKSNLLTQDEFYRILQAHEPQARLLFGSDAGYFAVCIHAPYLVDHGLSNLPKGIHGDSGTVRPAAGSCPRVLVVDDSATIRGCMRQLLEDGYEVRLADSGMDALREILTYSPDLVLLDYEMPVCSGYQVLELIRSDPALSELPVFFLTSRVDPESVRKVIPLRPNGYLSKHLPSVEIRQYVDRFFGR